LISLPLLALAACAGQAPAPKTATLPAVAESGTPLPLDKIIHKGVLENGLTYYVRANGKPQKRAELWLVVNAGSVLEDDDQRGLAHFLEHMAFNGTEHFPKQDLVNYLESVGMRFGADINAQTGFDDTIYTLTVPTDDPTIFAKGLDILHDWANAVAFEPAEFERERGVVREEWRLGRGAQARIRDQQFPVLFQGSRYADRLPIGTLPTIEHAPREKLIRFYKDWYRPDLMAVIAVGDLDPATIEPQIRARFADLVNPSPERARGTWSVPPHKQTLYSIASDAEETESSIAIYHLHGADPQGTAEDYRRSLVERLYHAMLNARLSEIAQRPDTPFLYGVSTTDSLVRTVSATVQGAGVPDGGIPRGLDALLTEIERVHRYGFYDSELARQKAELLRSYEQALAEVDKLDSSGFAAEYSRNYLEDEPAPGIAAEHAMVAKYLPTITLAETNRYASAWTDSANRVVLVSTPKKPGSEPPRESDVRKVFGRVEENELKPWVDRVVDKPLVPTPPKPGTIVNESTVPEVGLTVWTLSNGARVLLKPTDFQNDQIILRGWKPGGTSLASDADFLSANFAAPILREAGYGAFDSITLEKALAGKAAQAGTYIGELEEGVMGAASARDAETMFELAWLAITSPRRDRASFETQVGKLRASIDDRLADPQAAFGDAMRETLANHHPRRQRLTEEGVDAISLDTALRTYKDSFADASEFTFLLVGNLDVEKLRPLVLTYLGGLPSLGRHETWKDIGIHPPTGRVDVVVKKGVEPKAQVRLVWNGDAVWSRETVQDLDALADALNIRLREVLREDLGGVYGVGVDGNVTDRPRGRFTFTIGFGCAPERVDELVAATLKEIDAVRDHGLGGVYVEKVKETQKRERETALRENDFWVDVLESYDKHGLEPRLILRYDELVQRTTTERLKETALKTLDPQSYVKGVLTPEVKAPGKHS
jgi:zinc protease